MTVYPQPISGIFLSIILLLRTTGLLLQQLHDSLFTGGITVGITISISHTIVPSAFWEQLGFTFCLYPWNLASYIISLGALDGLLAAA